MKILFIGGGNMANAMLGGLIARGYAASEIGVVEIDAEARRSLAARHGVAVHAGIDDAAKTAETLVLAVKPQQLRAVAGELRSYLAGQTVVSIAAGIRLDDLARWLGGHRRLVRAMPNTPALVRAGVTGLFAFADVDAAARVRAEEILGAAGACFWVNDESMMDAVTAISGSGPAYVFHFLETLEAGALRFGFEPASARQMALETVIGAAKLAAESGESFAVLRQRVTSKGGTTEAALTAMNAAGVAAGIAAGLDAALARGRELGVQMGRDG